MMKYTKLLGWLSVAAVATLPCVTWGAVATGTPVIGPDLLEALRDQDRVRVMIFLDLPPAPPGNLEGLKRTVAQAQDGVVAVLSPADFTPRRRFETVPALAGEISLSGLMRLAGLSGVVRVDRDRASAAHLAEAVPLIRADEVHSLGFDGTGITVAVLDTGIDTDHDDMGDALDGEACFCSGDGGCCPDGSTTQFGAGAAEDDDGHGSNVTGVVTSIGVLSSVGVAPGTEIVAIKVLDGDGRSCCASDVVAGLDWIIANRPDVDIVNMSLGSNLLFAGDCDTAFAFTMAYAAAINTLRVNGVTTFASSGNSGSGTEMGAPACIANTLSVGAVYDANVGGVGFSNCQDLTTTADQVTCFSNSNSVTDMFAPGGAMTSDFLSNGLSTFYGTSQASPSAGSNLTR